jgi:hypothetical protein
VVARRRREKVFLALTPFTEMTSGDWCRAVRNFLAQERVAHFNNYLIERAFLAAQPEDFGPNFPCQKRTQFVFAAPLRTIMDAKLAELKRKAISLSAELASYRRRSLSVSKELGDVIVELKAILPHGKWIPWFEQNVIDQIRTPQKCKRIAENWLRPDFVAERKRNPDMDFTEADRFLKKQRKPKPKTSTQTILDALNFVRPGLTDRDVLEQSGSFIFENGRVHTFNDEIACSGPSPFGDAIAGAVHGLPLIKVLESVSDEDIAFSADDGELIIRVGDDGDQKAGIRLQEEITLPYDKVEAPTDWQPLPERFEDAVSEVVRCVYKTPDEYIFQCVHIHPDYLEACDNSQLIRWPIKTKVKESILLRGDSIEAIIGRGMIAFCETESWVHFRNREGFTLSCRRDVQALGPLAEYFNAEYFNFDGTPVVFPNEVAGIAASAEIFSEENPDENEVIVKIEPGTLRILGEGKSGWLTKSVTLPDYEGPEITFRIGPKLLVELVKRHPDQEMEIVADRLKVTTEDYTYVVALGDMTLNEEPEQTQPKQRTKRKRVAAET